MTAENQYSCAILYIVQLLTEQNIQLQFQKSVSTSLLNNSFIFIFNSYWSGYCGSGLIPGILGISQEYTLD